MTEPKAIQHTLAEYEITLCVRMRTDVHRLRELFDRDHAYGPVERLNIHRDMYSSNVPINADEGEFIDVVDVTELAESGESHEIS